MVKPKANRDVYVRIAGDSVNGFFPVRNVRVAVPVAPTLYISGIVYENGVGKPGVTIIFAGYQTYSVTTDSSGYYRFQVPRGFTGVATPIYAPDPDALMSPLGRQYARVTSSKVGHDYIYYGSNLLSDDLGTIISDDSGVVIAL